MVLRFISALLDKERYAYEQCQRYRRERLAEFRRAAIREFSFAHPDAKFLMNTNCEDFVVHTKNGEVTMFGIFCDHVFPQLDSVGETASPQERMKAVNIFKEKIQRYDAKLFRGLKPSKDYPSYVYDGLTSKGYFVEHEFKSTSIFSISLYKNDSCIGETNAEETRPVGTLAKSLYNNIVHGSDTTKDGISVVRLEIWGNENYGGSVLANCHIIYDGQRKFSGEAGFAEFTKTFGELGAFLSFIEPVVELYAFE